jgi:hypothetical protein
MAFCSCFSLSIYAAGPTVLSAPHFLHTQIVVRFELHNHENWFGFLQAGHVYLRASHHFCSAGIEPHVHLLAATVPIGSASS